MTSFTWIGKPVRRVDGEAKVRGALTFPSDLYAEGMLHCRPVLAPHPHARLLAIHTQEALKLPGVVRVLTHADVPGSNRYGYRNDHPVLCDDKTRYVGDMVAVVVAETEEAAAQGARMVKIDYEPLPLVTDPELAMQDDAPLMHPSGNILHQVHYSDGDVKAVFARPDVIVVEQTFRPQLMDHAFLETEAGVAFPEGGGVRVISGGQNAYYNQQMAAQCLALPVDKVRMVEPYTGGAFGGKGDITVHIVVALAALLTGRPCRMVWSREERFLAGAKRHPATLKMRCAANKNGDLLALEARIVSDTGAYAVFGDSVLAVMVENIAGPYRVPNVKIDAWSVLTNNAVCGAFRGYGASQACLALEGQMSELARRLGMDEIEFRKHNALTQGQKAGLGHKVLGSLAIVEALETAASHPLWAGRRGLRSSETIRRGTGMAISLKGYGLGVGNMPDYSAADLELTPAGRFILKTGVLELGQGSFTTLAIIAAEVLQCDPAWIDVQAGDTLAHPDSGTTAASRVTYAVGRAVVEAAQEMAGQIRALAASRFEVPIEQIELCDGLARDRSSGESLSLTDLALLASPPLQTSSRQQAPYSDLPATGGLAHPHVFYSSNVQIAQVAVDTETGEVTVEKVACFPEVGRVINRLGLEGQCEGGVAQGVGYALLEQVIMEQGRMVNADLGTYRIPTAADVPQVETIAVELPEATGPFGAKGAAENATLPTAPAILDAIAEAVGIRFTQMPVTPEHMVEALAKKGASDATQEG